MNTSTYKTYKACKENHPEDDIWYDDFHNCYQNTAYRGCSLGNITKCDPEDFEGNRMNLDKGENKRYHIVSDSLYAWHQAFVEGFDTKSEANKRRDYLESVCDPYEYLSVIDTEEQ